MSIAIVSDLHGNSLVLKKLIKDVFPETNEIWWIGDLFYNYKKDDASIAEAKDVLMTLSNYKEKPCFHVMGNTDSMDGYHSFSDRFESTPVCTKMVGEDTFILTHGHLHETRKALTDLAKEHHASVVITGHTHIAGLVVENDLIFVNPGSPTVPRDTQATPTYILFFPEEKKFQIKYLPTGETIQELYYNS